MRKEMVYTIAIVVVIACALGGAVFIPTESGKAIVIALSALICVEMMGLLQGSRAAEMAAIAAVRVAEVAVQVKGAELAADVVRGKVDHIETTLDQTSEVVKSSHVIINSGRDESLTLIAELSHFLANAQPSAVNTARAEQADRNLADHRAKQAEADRAAPPSGFGLMPSQAQAEGETPKLTAGQVNLPASVENVQITAESVTVTQADAVNVAQAEPVSTTQTDSEGKG